MGSKILPSTVVHVLRGSRLARHVPQSRGAFHAPALGELPETHLLKMARPSRGKAHNFNGDSKGNPSMGSQNKGSQNKDSLRLLG